MTKFPDKLVKRVDCKQGAVRSARFNVDGNYCMTTGSDKTVKLWNPHRGALLKSYVGHGFEVLDAQASCDSSQLVSCGMDKAVMLWDVATGTVLKRYKGHAGYVNCVKFNEESTLILSGSIDGTVRAWDTRSNRHEPVQVMDDAKDSVTSLAVSDHEFLSGSLDGRMRKYDLRIGEIHADFIGKPVSSVSFSRDGQCILVSTLDNSVKLMDKHTGEMLSEYAGHKNTDYRIDSCLSNSDSEVFSGSEDGFIYAWNLIDGSKVNSKLDHCFLGKVVHALSFHPTQPCLISACKGSLLLWAEETYEEPEAVANAAPAAT